MGVKRELAKLVARGLTVAAEQRHQRRARLLRNAQICDQQFVVDQFRKVPVAVRIAADRDRRLGALAGLAQWRFGAQLAGFDDDATIPQRHLGQRVDSAGKAA